MENCLCLITVRCRCKQEASGHKAGINNGPLSEYIKDELTTENRNCLGTICDSAFG